MSSESESNWTVVCASPRCRHVHRESERAQGPRKPGELSTTLVCPRCGCETFSKATAREIERAARRMSDRMDAAVAAQQ